MKKTLSLVLSLVMVLSVLTAIPFTAHAITEYSYTQDSSLGGNTFRYTLSGSEATITGFTALSAGTTDVSITIPSIMNGNTVVEIGEAVFDGNENIESVSIPASVKTINNYAFNLCSNLSSVTFESGSALRTIGNAAFGSTAISSITLPSKLQYITENAFEYCENLTSVTIPNSVKKISAGAFGYCAALTSVTIGNNVSDVKADAFTGCDLLSSISVNSANSYYSSSLSGVLYNKDKTTLILYPLGKTGSSFTLPDVTTTIGDFAFDGNQNLSTLNISEDTSLTTIGESAFRNCIALNKINAIPDSLTTIGTDAFKGVDNNLSVYSNCDHPLVASAIIQNVSTRTWNRTHGDYDAGTVTTPSTCTVNGVITYKCSKCGEVMTTEPAPLAEHKKVTVKENVVPATCTEDGTYDEVVKCSECGKEFSREVKTEDAKGHTPGTPVKVIGTKPTYTKVGYYDEYVYCTVCSAELDRKEDVEIPMLEKKTNTLTVKAKKPTVKYSKLKKKSQTITRKKAITVSKAKGTVSYKLSSAKKGKKSFKKYFKVNKKTGKITVKKGLKKGTYKVKVKVKAAGTTSYKSKSKTVTIKIKVK